MHLIWFNLFATNENLFRLHTQTNLRNVYLFIFSSVPLALLLSRSHAYPLSLSPARSHIYHKWFNKTDGWKWNKFVLFSPHTKDSLYGYAPSSTICVRYCGNMHPTHHLFYIVWGHYDTRSVIFCNFLYFICIFCWPLSTSTDDLSNRDVCRV